MIPSPVAGAANVLRFFVYGKLFSKKVFKRKAKRPKQKAPITALQHFNKKLTLTQITMQA